MKGLKCLKISQKKIFVRCFFVLICSVLSVSFVGFSPSVSALGIGSSYTLPLTVEGSFATVPSANPAIPYLDHGRLLYQVQGGAQITRLGFGLGNSPSGTPGLSNHPHIISFTIDYDFPSTMDSFYHSPSWTNMVLLHDSCYGAIETTFTNSFSCTYTLLTVSATNQVITQDGQFIVSTRVLNGTSPATWLTVTPVRVISLYNGVTEEQLDTLQTDIIQALDDLELTVQNSSGPTPAQIEAAVESAITDSGVISAQNATTNAIRQQTQQQHDDYESEVEREEAKEEELNDQKDDLNLSAQATANPFGNLFNFSGCVNMPTVGGWFNNPNLRVCSPYPSSISGVLNFVGSAIICGFLIRIYYKHMQGGFNG